jgi:dihydrofolate reductase
MSEDSSVVTIHMVASLDGFIEGKDGDISWMETSDSYPGGISDEEFETLSTETLSKIDCYVVGSRTYEMAEEFGWPYGETPTYVLTSRDLSSERESVSFYSGDLNSFLENELNPKFKNIWLVGGSVVVKDFIQQNLANEIVITFAPYLLGNGTPFFDLLETERALHLKDVTAFKNGYVEMTYEIKD